MSHDGNNSWAEKAKNENQGGGDTPRGKHKQAAPNKGVMIMAISEKLMPWLRESLEGTRDDDGLLVQQATIRGIALNAAQSIVSQHFQSQANA